MQLSRTRPAGDRGFTLIELLVAIVILGIVMVPLGNVILGYLRNSAATSARLGESHDEQIAAAYWQQDVASMGVRSTSFDSAAHTFQPTQSVNNNFPCAFPAGATQLVALSWTDYKSPASPAAVTVAYAMSGTQLLRVHCTGSTQDSIATLAHDLSATPTCSADGGAFGSCSSITGTPATINIRLSIADPSGQGQPYAVTLTGQRRQT